MNTPNSFFLASSRCDPLYKNVRDDGLPKLVEAKAYTESLWQVYAPYADPHFQTDAVAHFQERFWEMYLGATFLKHNFHIERAGNTGPEFYLANSQRRIWIEAIAPGPGEGPAGVPQPVYGLAQSVPIDETILRLRHALAEKKKKYDSYLTKNIVAKEDAFVVAINSKRIRLIVSEPELPIIVKAVYPFGNFGIVLNKETHAVVDTFHEYRGAIKKKNTGTEITTSVFLDNEYAPISAVIYSGVDCCNKPQGLGADFVLVHNSMALNKLELGTFKFGKEYWLVNDELRSKDWDGTGC